MRACDLFCGCGGFTRGLRDAGIDVVCGIDNNSNILATYRRNFEHDAVNHDLHDWKGAVKLLKPYKCEVVVGSPPCVEFSRSGNQVESDIASLSMSFANVVAALQPRVFVMENVYDAVLSRTWSHISDFFHNEKYTTCVVNKNAKHCGVAQCRKRLFMIGVLNASKETVAQMQDMLRESLRNCDAVSIRAALTSYGTVSPDHLYFPARNRFQPHVISADSVYPTMRSANGVCLSKKPLRHVPLRPNDSASVEDAAQLTTAWAAALSSFPPDFIWSDCEKLNGTMIGNCVCPKVARWLGRMLLKYLTSTTHDHTLEAGSLNPHQRKKLCPRAHIEILLSKLPTAARRMVKIDDAEHVDTFKSQRVEFRQPHYTVKPRHLSYEIGTSLEVDTAVNEMLGYTLKPGWTFRIKERNCQKSRIDDIYIDVPGVPVPYRGKKWLVKNNLI